MVRAFCCSPGLVLILSHQPKLLLEMVLWEQPCIPKGPPDSDPLSGLARSCLLCPLPQTRSSSGSQKPFFPSGSFLLCGTYADNSMLFWREKALGKYCIPFLGIHALFTSGSYGNIKNRPPTSSLSSGHHKMQAAIRAQNNILTGSLLLPSSLTQLILNSQLKQAIYLLFITLFICFWVVWFCLVEMWCYSVTQLV